ncbi:MAG: chemotaxis protein CheA [Ancalomicrobiaceae bacterium]|nr:chemotaxis protein CheA [Ancalomicrobiaceae bacterium]
MTDQLLQRFIPEARDLIETSASGLLRLEKNPKDDAAVNEVFRAVHTLKGSSGLFDAVALTHLVHAAEDLLSSIRADELILDSTLIDMLLASLDQVGCWIDHLERDNCLPRDADGISNTMARELRSLAALPGSAQPTDAAPPLLSGQAADLDPDWLDGFSEAERREAFHRLTAGATVLAVRYVPDEACFYSGTDPLGLVLATPELLVAVAHPVAAFALPPDLDPYRCNLGFTLLTTADRTDVEMHMRYELERVEIRLVAPNDLISVAGLPTDAPVWEDFREEAGELLAAGDLVGLAARAATLNDLMGPDLAAVAALRWLATLLAAPTQDRAAIAALIEATVTGRFVAMPRQIAPVAQPSAAVPSATIGSAPRPHAVVDPHARAFARSILAAQLGCCEGIGFDAARLVAPGRVVGNLMASLGAGDVTDAIANALQSARDTGSAAPFLRLVDRLDAELAEGCGATAVPTSASAPVPAEPAPWHRDDRPAVSNHEEVRDDDARPLTHMLKVDQAKIDLLMNLIGELVVSKNSLPFLAKRAEEVHGSREMSREIKEQYAVINRLAQEMQSAIMHVRMLPVSDIFGRFPRLVRDMARKLTKEIDLVIEGEDTAADKIIIEALGDPILHIVRNSLDHGIEQPSDRLAAGKPATATLLLKAYQEADNVVIEIRDDGRGIDPAAIRAAAVAKGVLDQARADALSDQEAINLIYHPGFSTAAVVSDLSGRGVGMDVVRTTIEKLAGRVSVTSRVGEGTRTRLSLPLTMSVTHVMMVEAAGSLYGVPMDLIVETVRVPLEAIHTIKQAEAFILRDTLIPLVRMSTLMAQPARRRGDGSEEAVLVCRVDGRNVGLVIDDFREGMDILLKPLEGIVAGIKGFAGTALLGDGRVLLILDLKELL